MITLTNEDIAQLETGLLRTKKDGSSINPVASFNKAATDKGITPIAYATQLSIAAIEAADKMATIYKETKALQTSLMHSIDNKQWKGLRSNLIKMATLRDEHATLNKTYTTTTRILFDAQLSSPKLKEIKGNIDKHTVYSDNIKWTTFFNQHKSKIPQGIFEETKKGEHRAERKEKGLLKRKSFDLDASPTTIAASISTGELHEESVVPATKKRAHESNDNGLNAKKHKAQPEEITMLPMLPLVYIILNVGVGLWLKQRKHSVNHVIDKVNFSRHV